MDKREEKTLEKIHNSFTKLINEKDYEDITIQDILDDANISRSTFYAHYKTKDELLASVSKHIFNHVFSKTLEEEKTHDYSKDTFFDYRHLIEHIFYHVKDEKELFEGILRSNGTGKFMSEFRKQLFRFADSYFNNYPYHDETPLELKKLIAVETFIVILKYWINNGLKESPEQIASYFISSVVNAKKQGKIDTVVAVFGQKSHFALKKQWFNFLQNFIVISPSETFFLA